MDTGALLYLDIKGNASISQFDIQNLPKTGNSIKHDYTAVLTKINITDPFITISVYHLSSGFSVPESTHTALHTFTYHMVKMVLHLQSLATKRLINHGFSHLKQM
jgi:hypothetical protein